MEYGKKWNEMPIEANPYDTFKELEIERSLVVFRVEGIVPKIVLDFKTKSISIEVGNFPSLTSGNMRSSDLKKLYNRLIKKYKPGRRKSTFGIKKEGQPNGHDPRKKDLEKAKK